MTYGSKLLTTASLAALMAMPVVEIAPANAQTSTIVVTARKREENIQDIPVSVSAYTSEALQRLQINNVNELAAFVPGFQFTNFTNRDAERPVIRGQANILGESGVSFFINGVFFDGSLSTIDISEVERIEVIRGPQSALYGRNTYSGAVNVITKRPGDEFRANMKLEAATHSQYEATFGVSGPVVEDILGVGIYARYYEYGGEHVNQFDGRTMGSEQSHSIAGNFNLTPTDNIEIFGRFVYSKDDDGAPPNFLQPASFNNVFNGGYFAGEVGPLPVNINDAFQLGVTDPDDLGFKQERLDASLAINWDLTDAVKLVSITGYQNIDQDFKNDVDYISTSFQTATGAIFGIPVFGPFFGIGVLQFDLTLDRLTEIEQFSQELRVEYDDGGRFRGMLGGYYYDQESVQNNRVDGSAYNAAQTALIAANLAAKDVTDPAENVFACVAPGCFELFRFSVIGDNLDINTTEITNWSIFGRAEYDVTDWLTASFEGRYQQETVTGTAFDESAGTTLVADGKFTAFLPRFSVTWDLTDDNLLFFNASRGTKPGGLNVDQDVIDAGFLRFEEEKLWSYEIGSKNTLADGQMVLNATFFYNFLKGYQLTTNVESGGMLDSAVTNAGDGEVRGIELETSISPNAMEGLTFTANYSYIDSEFTKGTDVNQGLLNDIGDDGLVNGSAGGFADAAMTVPVAGSIVGHTIPRSSMHQFFASVDYTQPADVLSGWAGADIDWFAGVNVAYNSPRFAQVLNLAEFGEATLLNASLGLRTDSWALTLWGKNLLDEDSPQEVVRYRDFNVHNPNPGGSSLARAFFGQLRRGRQIGGNLTASF